MPRKISVLTHAAVVEVRPTDVLADVGRQSVQETLGADLVPHGADPADIVLHAAQYRKTVHDLAPLFRWKEYLTPLLTAVCQELGSTPERARESFAKRRMTGRLSGEMRLREPL
ncbi:hypothetical protein MPLB_630025 [Mesorhizobium sp. ORS 3324]|nr:hypothetical protein MPLB_630025 [Mesorhizobium sp. ORS 3324]